MRREKCLVGVEGCTDYCSNWNFEVFEGGCCFRDAIRMAVGQL